LVRRQLHNLLNGTRSIIKTAWTVFPYLIGWGDLRKGVTEIYPDPTSANTEDDLPPRFRGLLYNDAELCTGCKECVSICPVQCIQVGVELGPNPRKKWISDFTIDFGKCIFCGFCVDVCEPESLIHTRKFEGAVLAREDLIIQYGKGEVSAEQKKKWIRLKEEEEFE